MTKTQIIEKIRANGGRANMNMKKAELESILANMILESEETPEPELKRITLENAIENGSYAIVALYDEKHTFTGIKVISAQGIYTGWIRENEIAIFSDLNIANQICLKIDIKTCKAYELKHCRIIVLTRDEYDAIIKPEPEPEPEPENDEKRCKRCNRITYSEIGDYCEECEEFLQELEKAITGQTEELPEPKNDNPRVCPTRTTSNHDDLVPTCHRCGGIVFIDPYGDLRCSCRNLSEMDRQEQEQEPEPMPGAKMIDKPGLFMIAKHIPCNVVSTCGATFSRPEKRTLNKAIYRIVDSRGRICYKGTDNPSWFTLEKAREIVNYEKGQKIYEHNGVNLLWEVF